MTGALRGQETFKKHLRGRRPTNSSEQKYLLLNLKMGIAAVLITTFTLPLQTDIRTCFPLQIMNQGEELRFPAGSPWGREMPRVPWHDVMARTTSSSHRGYEQSPPREGGDPRAGIAALRGAQRWLEESRPRSVELGRPTHCPGRLQGKSEGRRESRQSGACGGP